jgi:hypothetical protein
VTFVARPCQDGIIVYFIFDRPTNDAFFTLSVKECLTPILTGPDPLSNGIVRWRRMDLKVWIEAHFGVVYHERSVSRLLEQMGFFHISARPRHPGQDEAVKEDLKKTSPAHWRRPLGTCLPTPASNFVGRTR